MKKKLVSALAILMSITILAGCGSKIDEKDIKKGSKVKLEITELMENAVLAVADIDSIDVKAAGSVELKLEGEATDGKKMSIKGDADMHGKACVSEPAFEGGASISYELKMGNDRISGDHSASAYGETEDDIMMVYVKIDDDEWKKNSTDVSGFIEVMSSVKESIDNVAKECKNIDEEDLKEVEKFLKLEDTTKMINGKECYVLSADIDKEKFIELAEFTDDEYDEFIDEVNNINFSYSLSIDKDTYIPVQIVLNVRIDGEADGTKFDVEKLGMEVNIDTNSVKISDVPDDVKENAVKTDLGIVDNDWDDDLDDDMDDDLDDNMDDTEEETTKVSDESVQFNSDAVVDSSLIPRTIKIEGKSITFPCKVGDIKSMGFFIDEEATYDTEIDGYSVGCVVFDVKDSNFLVSVQNNSNETIDIMDGAATSIYICGKDINVELDNGIKIGDDSSSVEKVYANQEPSYVYKDNNIEEYQYSDSEYNTITYEYSTETGKIVGISLENFE